MVHKPASSALSDITVIDLTRARSGPTAVRQLADWGADVIKVEIPEALEPGDVLGGSRHGADFQNLQRNKRSLTLNLKDPAGVEILKRMVKDADVLIENYRPSVKHRLGIDYDTLSAINPRLVYGSISGFRAEGSLSRPARFRPDRTRHGRADVDHRRARPGTDARRHSD